MPTKSPLPSFDVPQGDLWNFLFERKDLPFAEDKNTDRTYTFAEARDAAIVFAKGLKGLLEWRKGEVLAIYTPNSIDVPSVMWGCHWAGGVVTTANPAYTADELAFQLKDSGASALVTQRALLETAVRAAEAAGIPTERILLLGDERDPSFKYKHFSTIRNLAGTSRYRRTRWKADDLAYLPYSSGTTGKPKGVCLSHANVASNVLMNEAGESPNVSSADSVLAFLPFFHIYGLTVIIHHAFHTGMEMVVMPKFDLENFCRLTQKHKITFAYIAPPVVLGLSKHPVVDKYDLSSLRMMNSGAAPLTKDLVAAMYKRIKVPVKQGYGLTETSPTTHMQPWSSWESKIGSVGFLLSNQEAKYVSEDGTELPLGQTGEIWIRGPNIFKGYLNNAEGTRNALTDDGFFKTGDVGYEDSEGHVYITDRVKELIKYKGFQVPPAELEGYLCSHPEIDDAAVVGVYDEAQATEVPRAYLVPKQGIAASPDLAKEVSAWLDAKVAHHKRLRGGIVFQDSIPKTASGKILRRLLRDKAKAEGKAKL